jgi:hypothetical protein
VMNGSCSYQRVTQGHVKESERQPGISLSYSVH